MIPKSMSSTPIGDVQRFSEKIMLHQRPLTAGGSASVAATGRWFRQR
jgi:hypothetical protein